MNVSIVSNFPADRRPVSEYAGDLVKGLKTYSDRGRVQVLSGRHESGNQHGVDRIWDYGSPLIPLQVLCEVRKKHPDAVMLHTTFSSWGSNAATFSALMLPWMLHRMGVCVLTLMHDLPHMIDTKKAGYKLTPFHHAAIEIATRSIGQSSILVFNHGPHSEYYRSHYPHRRVETMLHGLPGKPVYADLLGKDNILTFGKFGRAKNPEPLIQAFRSSGINGKLVVGGTSAANLPGFVEGLAKKYASESVEFTGYVPEEDVPSIFHAADLVVFPYTTNPGVSGVLFQMAQYGRTGLIKRLPLFEYQVAQLGLEVHFYDCDEELPTLLPQLLKDKHLLAEQGRHNFEVIQGHTFDKVSLQYWQLLETL